MGTKLSQIKILSKAELYNVFGLNVLRFSKDKRVKRRATLLLAVYCFLAVMIMFYVGSLSLGLCLLSLSEAVPAYLLAVASFFLFFLGIFKAGGVVFKKEGYDIISSLPVSQSAIVVSRFLRLYIEDLLFALAVLLPGLSVYAFFEKTGGNIFPVWAPGSAAGACFTHRWRSICWRAGDGSCIQDAVQEFSRIRIVNLIGTGNYGRNFTAFCHK